MTKADGCDSAAEATLEEANLRRLAAARPKAARVDAAQNLMADRLTLARVFLAATRHVGFWWYIILLEVCKFPHSDEQQECLCHSFRGESSSPMDELKRTISYRLDLLPPCSENYKNAVAEFQTGILFDSSLDFEISFRTAVSKYLLENTAAVQAQVEETLKELNDKVGGMTFSPLTEDQLRRLAEVWESMMIPMLNAFVRLEFQRLHDYEVADMNWRAGAAAAGAGAAGAGAAGT